MCRTGKNHKTSKPNVRKRGDSYTWCAYVTDGTGKRRQISKGGYRTIDHDHKAIFKDRHKTGAGHLIHLDPNTVELLRRWQEIQDIEKQLLGSAYNDDGFVFSHEDGRHYHHERFSREFLRKQQQYNDANPNMPLPRLTVHGLRHTWATIALKQKVHLKVVSERLNHSTTGITARVYSHVTRPIAQEAADLVAGLILSPSAEDVTPPRHTRGRAL